ncbi:MAG: hypothetical protein AVDCRST_MAG47-885 [uncultured Nocardioidaceae bacterium]|uniref:DUF456 domain-containing protein n=1 Tax=uncultured Nocardioidaceae bacterium TaxID=253824 RepID=A0A6J4MTP7_9ACTN|nr:MAG: hypothetical protein AVDCRST_MAG47-885 [uncultured Nocardioidaceae bacterium]
MQIEDVLAGVAIAVGLVGIIVPLLPGTLLVAAAVLIWAVAVGEAAGWAAAGVALLVLTVGTVVKYLLPGRHLKSQGIPTRTLALGGLLGVVGFFVVPVIGLPLGFVLGVYISEAQRLGTDAAWPATRSTVKAVGASILIELAAGTTAAVIWFVGAVTT